jgi:DNA-binding transcriptional ArsR family regulator
MSLLPSRLDVSPSPDEPRVLDIDGEDADAAFDALGSDTARHVLGATYEEPRTPAEIREEVGTSLQNVHYHLDNLESAGLIEPAGTGYSEKGNEVTVYAPASEAVVLFAGEEGDGSRLRERLKSLFGLALVVGLATAVFSVVTDLLAPSSGPETTDDVGMRTADAPAQSAADAAAAVDPVVAFFLGGCAVVAVLAVWWLLRPRLRSLAPSR